MTQMKAILFDLDDTLYDELSYVKSGMTAVAGEIAALAKIPQQTVIELLLELLAEGGRERIFDRALAALDIDQEQDSIDRLVASYRAHHPTLQFYPGVRAMLGRLRRNYRLAVVTDGLAQMQRAKVAALGLSDIVDVIVYTWELGSPKPAPQGYLAALDRLGTDAGQGLIVGDNPAHDLLAAAALGMPAIRVRTGRFKASPNPPSVDLRADIADVAALEAQLDRWTQAAVFGV